MVITLIGYRGTGKSTIGPRLAARLGWSFVDADPEIERKTGKTIRQIFETEGESVFREIEAETLAEVLGMDKLVLAPGGGAVLNDLTRQRMRDAGPVVWLAAPVDVILARMQEDATSHGRRPALTKLAPRDEVQRLLEIREPLYAETASLRVETAERSVDAIINEILAKLPQQLGGATEALR
jgi:shikimate kinase